MALEQQIEQLDSQEIQPNQKTIWENKVRENLAHNFLTSGIIRDLLYKTNTEKFRSVQMRTHVALLRMLFLGIDEGFIKLPTGTGKTLFFSEILCALQIAALTKAPTSDLVGQNMSQLIESGYDKDAVFTIPQLIYDEAGRNFVRGKNATAAHLLEGILKDIKQQNIQNPVIGSTYASLKSLFKNNRALLDKLIEFLRMLVSDEGHETMGNVGTEMKEYFMDRDHGNPHGKIHIMLTATPDRRKKSLKHMYHEIISINLQECFEDEILIRPGFDGVGKAYLPIKGSIEKKPSNYEIESSGKFISSEGRPIREVIVDKYAELLQKHVYFPAKFFCSTIKEAKDVEKYAKEIHGLRTIVQTNENPIADAKISSLIYNDEIDVVINVKMGVQGSDCRPLRCSARFNASNDPVFKTQGNGRIMRTMRDEDVEQIFQNIKNKPKYESYSEQELKEIIHKNTDNTRIIEPDKWVVTVPKKGRLPMGPKGMGKKRKKYVPTKDDPIDELPNSLEDMFLCDEVDSSYLAQHYPTATVHFTDIKEFFEQEKVTSLEELLMQDTDILTSKAADRFRGAKFQRIKQMLSARTLAGLNAIADFMGYTPMSQQRFDSIYKKAIKEHVKRHSIVTLFEHFNHQGSESPASFLLWRIKHGGDIRGEKNFVELVETLGVDLKMQVKRFLGNTNPIKLLMKGSEKLDQILDLTNNIRRSQGLYSFPHDVKKEKMVAYLGEYCGFDTLRDYFLKKLEKIGIHTLEEAISSKNWQAIVHELQDMRHEKIGYEMGIYAGYVYGNEFRRAFLRYMYGKEATDDIIYKGFINKLKKDRTIYTVFDLLKVLSTHSFNHSQEIRFHFSHKVDEIPVQTLVRFAKVGLKYNLIQTDDINNLAKDIELFKKSKYDFKYERRKNKLEKILGIDILRKQKEHQRKEEIKKNKAALKKPNLSHKSTKKIT